jgi:hypothetical protein
MMHSRRFILTFIGTLSLVGALPGLAQEKGKEAPKAPASPKAAAPAAPSQEEMMKAWMAVATPGDAHKKLEPLVGTFTVKTKAWMEPGKPPEETEGTSENKWVLGNRFIEGHFEGKMMNEPFSGIGYTGYDNYKKKYVGTWMDSMGTMIMSSTGTMDASGKKLTSWSTIDDVVMKKPSKIKSLLTIVDNDHHNFEMWGPGPDGKNFKMLEISYTRK